MMKGRLLTAREVAEQLGVAPETVVRWTRRGELPGFRLPGGALRYRAPDVDAWLAARATGLAGTGDRESPNARARTRRAGSLATEAEVRLSLEAPNARPLSAARTEEEHDAT
jgi:excisionase family DNA binding protein